MWDASDLVVLRLLHLAAMDGTVNPGILPTQILTHNDSDSDSY